MIKFPLYVTLDTNIFVANKFDFSENSTLGLLVKYVETNKIKIVLSNIVVKEVERRVIEEGSKICGNLRKVRSDILKTASEEYLKQVGLDVLLQIFEKKQYEESSRNAWKRFVNSLKAEILDTSRINLNDIIDDYFDFNPPFEKSDKKRNEFPDAFIANQIHERFGKEQKVAIISNDNGFKLACGEYENYTFYNTLGDLYDTISRQEREYQEVFQNINSQIKDYLSEIESLVMDNECVDVQGVTFDKDGIGSGFDYSECEVVSIENMTCTIRTIDEITKEKIWATLLCTADIDVECSYEDYDNAVWDHETRSYYFLETRKNFEKHSARFGVRIEVKRESGYFKIIPFKVILNGDTLLDCFEIKKEEREKCIY